MKVGLVCPYSWDVPGGVRAHVQGLAAQLSAEGHQVSVLAPGEPDTVAAEPGVVLVGRAVPVPFNGSVARLSFGPVSASRVRRWIRDGSFDVLHVHEPLTPSLSMLAVWAATGPIVGTFHAGYPTRSRLYGASYGILQPTLERITGRIAVSEMARTTVVEHVGGDPVLIPNGVDVARFAGAQPLPTEPGAGPVVGFLGRVDETRKGFAVLARALPALVARHPTMLLLVAGPGDAAEAVADLPDAVRDRVRVLGLVDEETKAAMLASLDLFLAPQLGGESFGIVLLEAMAAGVPVVASGIEAFRAVLDDGAAGELFEVGDADALTTAVDALLGDPGRRAALAAAGRVAAAHYDWPVVTAAIESVYQTIALPGGVREDVRGHGFGLFTRAREDA